jgi:predicted CXXCH cytochrome family protein
MKSVAFLSVFQFFLTTGTLGAEARILRPADKSVLPSGEVDIVATAPEGKLEMDGKPVPAEKPFPDVLHARLKIAPGEHKLAIVSAEGRQEIRFYSGPQAPADFAPFRQHPPAGSVECTHCHELTRRGRFHFKGGESCLGCHQKEAFAKVHSHPPEVLNECGLCHNAHGSAVKSHLLLSKEAACKQCHN